MKNLKQVLFFAMCFLVIGLQFAEAQVKETVKEIVKEEVKEKKEAVKTEILVNEEVEKEKTKVEKLNSEDDKSIYSAKAAKAKKVEKSAILKKVKETPKTIDGKIVPKKALKETDSDEYYDLEKEEKEDFEDDDDDIEDYE